jgi:hypothetical protein
MTEKLVALATNSKNRAWSTKDIDDLKGCLRAGMPLGQTANFLERTQADVQKKLAELRLRMAR